MWRFFKKDKTGKDKAQADELRESDAAVPEQAAEPPAPPPETDQPEPEPTPSSEPEPVVAEGLRAEKAALEPDEASGAEPQGWLARLRGGLARTRSGMTEGLGTFFLGKKEIDDDLLEELENRLLLADVGVEATTRIIGGITERVGRRQLTDVDALMAALRENMAEILRPVSRPLAIDPAQKPYVILVVGVNGAGKTTTIGKLARRFQSEGRAVMLAAGDTFRAAAIEQLQAWGERSGVPVVAQHSGADSASVIFDALQAARSRQADVLIADTAGRLHTQANLMEELKKVKRVLAKLDERTPHETLLVVDASNGQNALNQARQFHQAIDLDGVVLTKLDGTAKGGVIFAIAEALGLPIRFIGVGEGVEDLRPFDADEFVAALLDQG